MFYFGIVDVLQPYTLKKQLEHSIKALVQVPPHPEDPPYDPL